MKFNCYRTKLILKAIKGSPGTPRLGVPSLLDFVPESGGLSKLRRRLILFPLGFSPRLHALSYPRDLCVGYVQPLLEVPSRRDEVGPP